MGGERVDDEWNGLRAAASALEEKEEEEEGDDADHLRACRTERWRLVNGRYAE